MPWQCRGSRRELLRRLEPNIVRVLRGVLEAALVEYLTIPQLGALARFYATPEGAAVMRKLLAFNDAVTPALEAAVSAWARELAARLRAQAPAGEATT